MSLLIDPRRTLVVRAPTERMNPIHDAVAIELERKRDPVNAAAEYDGIPRSDSSLLYEESWIESAVDEGVHEREPAEKDSAGAHIQRYAWSDTSGGGKCQMTLAIARREKGRGVLECVRGYARKKPRLEVVKDIAETMKRYGLTTLHRDQYGGDLVTALFSEQGISAQYAHKPAIGGTEPSKVTTSYVFIESVAMFATGRVSLLDHSALKQELLQLERRTGPSGNDKAGKPPMGYDDLAAAAVGALWLAARVPMSAGNNEVFAIKSRAFEGFEDVEAVRRRHLREAGDRQW